MYTDATQWSRIRERLLDKGESLRSVSLSEGIARPTLRRILASELPSRYRRVSASLSPAQDSFIQHLKQLVSENRTAAPTERASVRAMHAHLEGLGFDASYRVVLHRAHRIRRQDVNDALDVCSQVEQLDDRDAARLLRALCHPRGRGVLDEDKLSRHLAELRATSPETTVSRAQAKWGQWVAQMERTHSNHASPADPSRRELLASLEATSRLLRQRSLCVLAHRDGFSIRQIATMTSVSRTSIRRYLAAYRDGGCAQLISRKPMAKMADDPKLKEALFSLLHEPPSLSGVNHATWKLEDVRRVLTGRGFTVGASVIRQVIRAGGFRWKSAKVVLTSHDPKGSVAIRISAFAGTLLIANLQGRDATGSGQSLLVFLIATEPHAAARTCQARPRDTLFLAACRWQCSFFGTDCRGAMPTCRGGECMHRNGGLDRH